MKVKIIGVSGTDTFELTFDKNVVDVGPAGSFFKVVEVLEEQTTASGLVASVAGGKRHTWIPASIIRKVEVVE